MTCGDGYAGSREGGDGAASAGVEQLPPPPHAGSGCPPLSPVPGGGSVLAAVTGAGRNQCRAKRLVWPPPAGGPMQGWGVGGAGTFPFFLGFAQDGGALLILSLSLCPSAITWPTGLLGGRHPLVFGRE